VNSLTSSTKKPSVKALIPIFTNYRISHYFQYLFSPDGKQGMMLFCFVLIILMAWNHSLLVWTPVMLHQPSKPRRHLIGTLCWDYALIEAPFKALPQSITELETFAMPVSEVLVVTVKEQAGLNSVTVEREYSAVKHCEISRKEMQHTSLSLLWRNLHRLLEDEILFLLNYCPVGARGTVVCCGTMLQAGSSVPMEWIFQFA
jgi:hypothetical protein